LIDASADRSPRLRVAVWAALLEIEAWTVSWVVNVLCRAS
jgi:hypothetical protein